MEWACGELRTMADEPVRFGFSPVSMWKYAMYRREVTHLKKCVGFHHARVEWEREMGAALDREGADEGVNKVVIKFSSYLRMSLREVAVELAEIHWSAWVTMLVMVLLNLARYKVKNIQPVYALLIITCFEAGAVLSVWVLFRREK
jgi:hypothetical protein